MDLPVILVMIVLVMAILLFIFEWVRVDVVGIIMMVCLPLLGLVTPKEAISGLSSNAVVSIIAVIIIGAGLDKTGAMNVLARILLRFAGKSESRIMLLISGTVSFISSFMQNIGAAALFMPATKRICRQTNIPVSRILMPMGFLAIIGGCLTLIGSSPLILLNDVMRISNPDAAPFGLFAVTPVGLALVLAGLVYFLLLGRLVLPSGQGEEASGPMSSSLMRTYQDIGSLAEINVPESVKKTNTLAELEIRPHFFVTVVGIAKAGGGTNFTPMPDDTIGPGDVLAVNGAPDMIRKLAGANGWEIKEDLEIFAEHLSPNNAGIMEVIISPRSDLTQRTLRSSEFRRKYGVNPLALFRGNKTYVAGISTLILETGDALLLQGRWEKFHFLKQQHDLIFTEDVQGEILRTEKIKFAVGSLLLSLTLILIFHVQLSIALLTGALGMVLTRVLSIDEAYQSVDWMTVFLLGGLIPLGIAFEKTGAAKLIAESIMSMMGSVSPLILLTVVGLLTSFFTLVVSNVGATVLMVPLAMNMAGTAGADPRIAALVVAVACSNTFILPTHQVNALVMRPGGYRTIDYFKAGTGMTVLYLIVMMAAVYVFYGVSG
ncbi:SLC13 family permease [Desulfopila inferna]|uniref:SLC13 family permease n=1 Tax=Desulfopila inferna TaxID=468528 RepID=UPI0019646AB5|nr:SLC13 family permease [Desulfopila inferna]MBM9603201.1 SLC13 family permease [Desulfopila inferna]